jgi:hypothetical protein
MFGELTDQELKTLRSMMFEGSQRAYTVATLNWVGAEWFYLRRDVHMDVAQAYIEVAQEMLARIHAPAQAA